MNPASQVPLLVSDEGEIYGDSSAICEFIEEIEGQPSLIGSTPNERASVRKIANWFNNKFYYEVTKYLLDEKVFKYLKRAGEPNTEIIRAGENNLSYQMDFIAYLLQQHKWLAGEYFSLADITAAAHLSCLDFLGDVPWKKYAEVKEWYALVKSRPSFRPLLTDTLAGFTPAAHYSDLDF
jgi:glutathione S-transferase